MRAGGQYHYTLTTTQHSTYHQQDANSACLLTIHSTKLQIQETQQEHDGLTGHAQREYLHEYHQ